MREVLARRRTAVDRMFRQACLNKGCLLPYPIKVSMMIVFMVVLCIYDNLKVFIEMRGSQIAIQTHWANRTAAECNKLKMLLSRAPCMLILCISQMLSSIINSVRESESEKSLHHGNLAFLSFFFSLFLSCSFVLLHS